MKEVAVGKVPAAYRVEFEASLFHGEVHRKLQTRTGWKSFHLVDREKKRVYASVHFAVRDGVAYSPFRAPFGSFEWAGSLDPSELFSFMKEVEARLRKGKVKRIEIVHAPVYRPDQHLATVFFCNLGYEVNTAGLAAFLQVDESSFADKLDAWPRRKLKQAQAMDVVIRKLPLSAAPAVYDFIRAARKERGYPISMLRPAFLKTVDHCRDSFHLFGVFLGGEMIAASVSIRVKQELLYNFYLAHSKSADTISPVVALLSGIYEWSRLQGIRWIDLGTSVLGGLPNFPLLGFKLRTGAVPVAKFGFVKNLGT